MESEKSHQDKSVVDCIIVKFNVNLTLQMGHEDSMAYHNNV